MSGTTVLGAGATIYGSGGTTTITGSDGAIVAGSGDVIVAAASDTVLATGATTLGGANSGTTNFTISGANSFVLGGDGGIAGTASGVNSTLVGGAGTSEFTVTGSNALVVAGASGLTGVDLSGSTGPEEVETNPYGGNGQLVAVLGRGADTVIGGGGASTVTAGSGSDVFGFINGHAGGSEVILGFSSSDVLDFSGYGYSAANHPMETVVSGSDVITLTDGTTITLFGVGSSSIGDIVTPLTEADYTPTSVSDLPCYLRGTRILTADGEVAVEDLAVGMLVRTASGALRPVTWTGHRRMNVAGHPRPETVYPILISRGAFGEGLPVRDLYVSPDHSLFIDGVLIPARLLVNGVTVQQARRETVEYWHVELESHDIILAEGLPAESYLDTANRAAFVENGAFCQLHPDFAPKSWDDACAPLVQDGPKLAAARAMLKDRAAALGFAATHEFDVHVLADGARIEALRLPASRFVFMLPEGAREIALASRDFIPAHMSAASTDGRRLGICVKQLQLDGAQVALDDARLFGEGWQKLETDSDGSHKRWTNGAASLPAGVRLVVVDILHGGQYWMAREQPAQPKLSVVAYSPTAFQGHGPEQHSRLPDGIWILRRREATGIP